MLDVQKSELSPKELLIHQAVFLHVNERLSQSEIAARLSRGEHTVDRSTISRCLTRARELGVLHVSYDPGSAQISRQVTESLYWSGSTRALEELLVSEDATRERNESIVPEVHVVCGPQPSDSAKSFDQNLMRFGPCCSAIATELLTYAMEADRSNENVIGIGWGRTLRSIVDAMSVEQLKVEAKDRPVVPLWGEAYGPDVDEWKGELFTDRNQLSSTTLARDLAVLLNRGMSPTSTYSLDGVPTMLPAKFAKSKEQSKFLTEFFAEVSAWGQIFVGKAAGRTPPLANRMCILFAGAGSSRYPGRFLSPDVLKNVLTKREQTRLLECVLGDIAGVLIEKPDLDADSRRFIKGLNSRWLGVRREHLELCAARGRRRRGAGVCVFAIGEQRAALILAGIRMGLLNHVVCDASLSNRLTQLCQES